jgi:ketosteroid isomerase-like protein
MYAAIVERIVRDGFRQLSNGRPTPVLRLFAEDAELRFPGVHALGGHWRGRAEIAGWFERLLRTLPGIRFDIHDVHVRGMPWNTRVLTRFTDTVPMPGGPPVVNHGVQYLRLRWGRIVEDVLYLDTQVVADACARAGQAAPPPAG